jgi:hypothetical protein
MVLRRRRSVKKCAADEDGKGTAKLMGDALETGRGLITRDVVEQALRRVGDSVCITILQQLHGQIDVRSPLRTCNGQAIQSDYINNPGALDAMAVAGSAFTDQTHHAASYTRRSVQKGRRTA